MERVSIALDWRPNINHIGFLLARDSLRTNGVLLNLVDPNTYCYESSTIEKMLGEQMAFALAPLEHYIFLTDEQKKQVEPVAPVFQQNAASIIARGSLNGPADLQGKTYLGYNTPLEQKVMELMIKNDKGSGTIKVKKPYKLVVFHGFLLGNGDFTWGFDTWENIYATFRENETYTTFNPVRWGVPYCFSPTLFVNTHWKNEHPELFKKCLQQFEYEWEHVFKSGRKHHDALKMLQDNEFNNHDFLQPAFKIAENLTLTKEGKWGTFDKDSLQLFIGWITSVMGKPLDKEVSSLAFIGPDRIKD